MAASNHKATIGRQVWVWTGLMADVMDAKQAFAATVIFVDKDNTVDVLALTHTGVTCKFDNLEVRDPTPEDMHDHEMDVYASWMPYQENLMDANTAKTSNESLPQSTAASQAAASLAPKLQQVQQSKE